MKTTEFLKKLKELDERLDIIPNINRTADKQKCGQGISNIMLSGKDIDCPIPSEEIKDYFDPHYYYQFPNGMMAPFRSTEEALEKSKKMIDYVSTKEGNDLFFDKEE